MVHADDDVVGDVAAHRHDAGHFSVRHAAAHGRGGADVVVGRPRECRQGGPWVDQSTTNPDRNGTPPKVNDETETLGSA